MFTVDTLPPVITVGTPADGLITNQPNQTLQGQLNEPAALILNDQPIAVDANLTFSQIVSLQEGVNSFTLLAIDPAGNEGQRTVQVTLDTVLPASPDP